MTLVKNNYRPVNFNSVFNELFNEFPFADKAGLNFPPVNIAETADAYHIELNAPGRNKEEFKINAENGLLTISYEKKEEAKSDDVKSIRREFSFQGFKRSFSLDDKVDLTGIQAKYENGLLKLLLPKKAEIKEAANGGLSLLLFFFEQHRSISVFACGRLVGCFYFWVGRSASLCVIRRQVLIRDVASHCNVHPGQSTNFFRRIRADQI